jgi:hypothetical protein
LRPSAIFLKLVDTTTADGFRQAVVSYFLPAEGYFSLLPVDSAHRLAGVIFWPERK